MNGRSRSRRRRQTGWIRHRLWTAEMAQTTLFHLAMVVGDHDFQAMKDLVKCWASLLYVHDLTPWPEPSYPLNSQDDLLSYLEEMLRGPNDDPLWTQLTRMLNENPEGLMELQKHLRKVEGLPPPANPKLAAQAGTHLVNLVFGW